MDLQTPTTAAATTTNSPPPPLPDEADSACSTPYVSAPSSPGHNQPISGFYYSAPTSPMHFSFSSSSSNNQSFEFEFSAKFNSAKPKELSDSATMSSADELFLDGKIRPMKLSTHLQTPQVLAPLLELSNEDRGRELRTTRDGRIRRTRSMSPMRNLDCEWNDNNDMHGHADEKNDQACNLEEATTVSASSSAGRSSSKRWVFLKDFLRSKSEGRSNNKFWSSTTFSPAKEKKCCANPTSVGPPKKMGNGAGKRRVPPSAHELHYTANRAQAEEMRKKTYLPYRQGLLGCLGFSSKGYGAVNGFARALNPVSSR